MSKPTSGRVLSLKERQAEAVQRARRLFGVRLCKVGVVAAWRLITYPTPGRYEDWVEHLDRCNQCNKDLGRTDD
jgi:hypothetical protein